jgi:CBS domain-containing protein
MEVTMTVRAILTLKGRDCITIAPEASLAEAAKLMAQKRIGALVITGPERRVTGILSERDIVAALAAHGQRALEQSVGSVMTREVVTCGEDETVPELMQRMTGGRFRHVPVLERNQLAGIVSIGDVVKFRLAEMEREHEALREYIATA